MEKKIPVYECKITGTDNTGVFAISFVDYPANESNFIALSKQKPVKLAYDKQKQVLTGVVLIPNQLIYRYDDAKGEYYIRFTAQDIEKIALKMMRTGLALKMTTHQHEKPLKGNYLVESWIVSDPKKDKTAALGLGEYPKGTLVVSYKVEDPTYWRNEVMTGNVKGFSLEGLFNFNNVNMKKTVKTAAQLGKEKAAKGKTVSAFLRSVATMLEGDTSTEEEANNLVDEAAKDDTDSGTPYLVFELADGGEVWVDEEGFATLDGEQMPAGEHALADGNFIVIDDSGMLAITQPEAGATDPAQPTAELSRAKARGKEFLKKFDPKAAQITQLKKRLAQLEKEPSTDKAEPSVETSKKNPAEMTHTEKMAAVLKGRRERMDAKKTK